MPKRQANATVKKAMNPNTPSIRGTAQNEDIYFQATEVRNKYYDKVPDIVANYTNEINKITGKDYKPQKSRDAAIRFKEQRTDDAFVEILRFRFYEDHVDFSKSGDSLKKNLLNSTRVSMVIPVVTDAAEGTGKVPAASDN